MATTVEDCPCGQPHEMDDYLEGMFRRISYGLPATVAIQVNGVGTWSVPRVYLACHGLKPSELPRLAGEYGWEKISA